MGLPWFSYRANFGPSKAHFRSKNMDFFHKKDFFRCLINRPERLILMKKVRESCVLTVLTRIHNIGHIHNANFVQTQFSTSHPQKQHFLKSWEFTFLWKYSVCGLKFEISEYPIKLLYVTYSHYKYELKRMKTHEIRAKYFWTFFNSVHCIEIFRLNPYRISCIWCLSNMLQFWKRKKNDDPTLVENSFFESGKIN